MSNLSANGIKEISTRYVHFQSEPRPCYTASVTGVLHIVFSPAWKYTTRLLSPPSGNIRLARRVPRPVRGAQIKTRNQPKGICPGKNGAGPSIRIRYHHHSARIREREREREKRRGEKERKMKREQEREDNISIVLRGERRERKFIPTPGFSKLVRRHRRGDRSISRKLAPLFSCLSSLSLFLSLVSRSPIPTREESKPDRFASTYSTMACLHGEH